MFSTEKAFISEQYFVILWAFWRKPFIKININHNMAEFHFLLLCHSLNNPFIYFFAFLISSWFNDCFTTQIEKKMFCHQNQSHEQNNFSLKGIFPHLKGMKYILENNWLKGFPDPLWHLIKSNDVTNIEKVPWK